MTMRAKEMAPYGTPPSEAGVFALPALPLLRPSLALLLAVSLPLTALAQQTGNAGILQTNRIARTATNLAPPTQAEDSFMGQEKTGPYILTWRKFQFGPGNPVWVFVDGRRLNGAEYTLDSAKGEIVFADPLKRTQLVRVAYGYYPEVAERNPNPSLSAPLSMTLASLGIGELKMATLTGVNGSTTPRVVLGLGSNQTVFGGGLTSQIYVAPDKIARGEDGSAAEQSSVKLGYAGGDKKNGFNLGFQRGGRDFAQSVGRNLGMGDASQNLDFGGQLNPNAATSLSFSQTDTRNLLNPTSNRSQNAAVRLGGLKGQPLLNFTRSEAYKTDAKGVTSGSTTEKGDLGGKFGALDLAYRTSRVANVVPNKPRTEVSQNVLSANLPAGKGATPGLSFSRTEDGKVDGANARTDTITDVAGLTTRLGGVNLALRNTQSDTILPDKRRATSDQQLYSIAIPGGKIPFRPGINYTRIDETRVDGGGTRSQIAGDQGDFAGKFGIADIVAKINRSETMLPDRRAALTEQQNLSVNLAAPKQPTLGYQRTGDVKIDANGLRIGTVADQVNLAGKVNNIDLQFKSALTDVGAKEGTRTATDVSNLTLKYGGDKGRPTFGFFRDGNEKRVNDGGWYGGDTSRLVVDHKVGSALVGYQFQQADVTAPNQKQASGDLNTFRVALPGVGVLPGVTVQRQMGEVVDPNAVKADIVADQVGVTTKLGVAALRADTKQVVTTMPDPLDSGVARENAFTIDGAGKKTGAAVTVTNAVNQTGRLTDEKQGLTLTFKPMPNITLGIGQQEQAITPAGAIDPTRTINSQTTSAELIPVPGTRLFSAWTTKSDGPNRSSITDYAAKLGTEKTAFKIEGSLRDREANTAAPLGNADTANATFQVRPAPNLTVTGTYLLNPEDPKKPGTVTPIEKREYGLKAKLGALEVGGTYAATELLPGTPDAIIAKAGAPEYGEMGLSLGWRFGPQTRMTGQYKDTFFNGGAVPKGLETYTLGFTHAVGSQFTFSLNGTLTNNRMIVDPTGRTNYRAEAKVGVKF